MAPPSKTPNSNAHTRQSNFRFSQSLRRRKRSLSSTWTRACDGWSIFCRHSMRWRMTEAAILNRCKGAVLKKVIRCSLAKESTHKAGHVMKVSKSLRIHHTDHSVVSMPKRYLRSKSGPRCLPRSMRNPKNATIKFLLLITQSLTHPTWTKIKWNKRVCPASEVPWFSPARQDRQVSWRQGWLRKTLKGAILRKNPSSASM